MFKHLFSKIPFKGLGMYLIAFFVFVVVLGLLMASGIIEVCFVSPYNGSKICP
jgi:hypothetical protein